MVQNETKIRAFAERDENGGKRLFLPKQQQNEKKKKIRIFGAKATSYATMQRKPKNVFLFPKKTCVKS